MEFLHNPIIQGIVQFIALIPGCWLIRGVLSEIFDATVKRLKRK